MKTSDAAIQKIKTFEGMKCNSYKCPAGVWTIGFGHTKGVRQGQKITEKQAEALLRDDLEAAESALKNLKLNQNQFDALVDFIFNLGAGSFEKSTLRKLIISNPNNPEIKAQFARWIYAKGRPLQSLIDRRKWEADNFFKK